MLFRILAVVILGVGGVLGAVTLVAAPAIAGGAVVAGALIGLLALIWVYENVVGSAASKAWAGVRVGAIVAAWFIGGCLVIVGAVLLLGSASGSALLLLLLVSASVGLWRRRSSGSPWRVDPWSAVQARLLRTARHPEPPRPVEPPLPVVLPSAAVSSSAPSPTHLSTSQLCLAWQRTYFLLLDRSAPASRGEVVALRERLLDEIERRDADGFTRWLDTGARAGSNPGRYLTGDR